MTLVLNGTTGVSAVDGSASTPAIQGNDTNTGVFFPAADTVAVATGGSERVRVDSSGNVGIGTSSPTNNLQVEGKASAYAVALVKSNGGAGNGYGASFQLTNTNGDNYQIRVADSGSGSTYQQALDFLTISAPSGKGLRFSAGGAESSRIDSSGNFLFGTTTAGGVGQTIYTNASGRYTFFNTSAASGFTHCIFAYNGTGVGNIQTTTNATSYVTSSDYRLKEQVAPMIGALARVAALKPCTYKWKADGSDGEGFIAHELAEVCPQAVTGEKDAVNEDGSIKPQGIDTSFLVATLTAALQELTAKLTAAEARIAALEAK